MPAINDQTEIKLLLKSIEAESKHARNVLFALILASLYILLSAYFAGTEADIELPILKVKLSYPMFFAVSPGLIMCLYLYLHLFVHDLLRKLAVFQDIDIRLHHIPSRPMLLFPWILTLPVSDLDSRAEGPREFDARGESRFMMADLRVRAARFLLIWMLGPLVLFMLWLRFVTKGQTESVLFPCLAIIGSLFGSSRISSQTRLVRTSGFLFAVALLLITAASVPSLRSLPLLGSLWALAVIVSQTAKENLGAALQAFLLVYSPLVLAGFILESILPTKLKAWLFLKLSYVLPDRKFGFGAFATRASSMDEIEWGVLWMMVMSEAALLAFLVSLGVLFLG